VEVWEHTDSWLNAQIGTSARTNIFAVSSIALTLEPLGTELLQIPAQSLIGSLGTLLGTLVVGNTQTKGNLRVLEIVLFVWKLLRSS